MTGIDLVLNNIPVSPASKAIPHFDDFEREVVFEYLPSADGVDTNLLILFHGLGDTPKPFTNLAKTLKLPQTAFLILRAFERVPLLEEEAYQWWDSFDSLTGELVQNPNPSKTLSQLNHILNHLTSEKIGWHPSSIHLFGFAQGGSCAAEFVLHWTRNHKKTVKGTDRDKELIPPTLGSLVTISGPLLSLPTISSDARSQTPTLLWVRKHQDSMGRWRASFSKGFAFVEYFTASVAGEDGQESMPRGREWEPVMQFWSKHLRQRNAWELSGSNASPSVSGSSEIYQVNQ
ncbi:hypothetical protein CROQUDRAFT_39297 [Cronartium quercuum f. sp. fusiforme G11]|uniref:Phospholipase/carboxylesterase/thioesterase domain-containing protein n=1 Tax=Cronartium quercuum f. sp. fusiforme G11 TaxID=708437 RepID=A0A9P6NMJ2_9BASI|nr:hypothetical protein CROQUDRAFT_39297 [Cronartium quercuum f. sp. fusiforme G11]